ncbi:MAG: efflux RND transporter periplasmic adaptor subunit, partial [Anaerolineae bacterium]|nr:efflux RND transporter periplasmic adaptor subunit [Anaerolineae bacterium]
AAGPTEDEIAQAEIDLRQAEIALESAQAAYDRAGGGWRVEVDYTNTATNLWQAQANYEAALASYAATMEGAASTERWAAWAKVEQSQASLDKLLASPAEEDVRLAEISVEQAELSLAQARHNLELATLIAPIGGVVTQVNVEEGSTAGGIAIVISDLNALAVELSLDESDVAQVLEGQSAVITLEAFDDVELSGAVVYVAPTANIQSGVVLYDVTVVIDPAGVAVRVGMTADVEIISVDVEDVLLIPAGAVQTLGQRTIVLRELAEGEAAPLPAMENRETLQAGEGMTLTERMAGAGAGRLAQLASGFAPVPVELGARSETHVEVISGLEEGDVVVLTDLAEITEQMGGMGPFGGARPFGGAFGGARP